MTPRGRESSPAVPPAFFLQRQVDSRKMGSCNAFAESGDFSWDIKVLTRNQITLTPLVSNHNVRPLFAPQRAVFLGFSRPAGT
jgi:hypothetical protein